MTAFLLAGPATEPISLADAKAFLRVDSADEDSFITTLIAAARLHVESVTGRALISQTWRLVCDAWPEDRVIELPIGPLQSISQIVTYDAQGDPTSLALAQFQPETDVSPGRLFLPQQIDGATLLRERGGIEVDFIAGFGAAPEQVPADMRQAVLVLVGYWFEHRDAVVMAGSGAVVPAGFDNLVGAYRRVRI